MSAAEYALNRGYASGAWGWVYFAPNVALVHALLTLSH